MLWPSFEQSDAPLTIGRGSATFLPGGVRWSALTGLERPVLKRRRIIHSLAFVEATPMRQDGRGRSTAPAWPVQGVTFAPAIVVGSGKESFGRQHRA